MAYFEIFIVFCPLLFLSCLSFRNKKGLPTYWPLAGMLPALLKNYHRINHFLTECLEKSQLTFFLKGPWFSNLQLLITVDPANAHHVLIRNFGNYPKGSKFKEIFEPLGDGIFNSDGDLWQYHRKMAQTFFSRPQFQPFLVKKTWEKAETGLFPILHHVSSQGLEVDLQDLFERFTFDTIYTILMGHDPKSLCVDLPNRPICKAMDDAEVAILYRHIVPTCVWKLQRWLNVGKEKKLKEAVEVFDDFIFECLSRKREDMSKRSLSSKENKVDNEVDIDIIMSYMDDNEASAKTKSDFDIFLRDTTLNLLLAGRETTSTALSWLFYLLMNNPNVVSKIREELDAAMVQARYSHDNNDDKMNGHPLYNYLSGNFEEFNEKLVYLHGAVCEALRLYPPVAFNAKAPIEVDILPSGHRVDPSMQVIFHIYAMGRMKSIWGEDCCEFKPERWISKTGKINHEPSYKLLAFNSGPRICVGKQMSLTQVKVIALAIISNYDIQPVEGHLVAPDASVILRMKHGLKVKVVPSL